MYSFSFSSLWLGDMKKTRPENLWKFLIFVQVMFWAHLTVIFHGIRIIWCSNNFCQIFNSVKEWKKIWKNCKFSKILWFISKEKVSHKSNFCLILNRLVWKYQQVSQNWYFYLALSGFQVLPLLRCNYLIKIWRINKKRSTKYLREIHVGDLIVEAATIIISSVDI